MRTSARRNLKRILSFARGLSTNDVSLVAWHQTHMGATESSLPGVGFNESKGQSANLVSGAIGLVHSVSTKAGGATTNGKVFHFVGGNIVGLKIYEILIAGAQ